MLRAQEHGIASDESIFDRITGGIQARAAAFEARSSHR